jgi:hypothetical protein
VNYFFKPAIAVIYIVFVAFYLVGRDLLLSRPLSEPRRLAIAAGAVSDLALGQLSESGRAYALELLADDVGQPKLAGSIRDALGAAPPATSVEGRITRGREALLGLARRLLAHRHFEPGLIAVAVLQAVVILGELALLLLHPALGRSRGTDVTTRAAEVSAGISGLYTLFGCVLLVLGDHAAGLRVLFRSVLITILVTQIFVFTKYQASGIIVLLFDLLLLAMLRLAGEAQPAIFERRTPTATG